MLLAALFEKIACANARESTSDLFGDARTVDHVPTVDRSLVEKSVGARY